MSALPEARESLTYWESRHQSLPVWALRQRREAREMAARWRDRVSQAELAEYGPGIIGAIFMLLAEQRLPSRARHTSRQLVRVGKGALIAAAVTAASLFVLACVLVVALFAAIF